MASYQTIIGLEVHIELKTKSKMFCGCSAESFGHQPNTHVCPTCLGLPGALPYPNQKAIESTLMAGLALGCQIPLFSKFDRKNYFYPDLPKGYQISQYDLPFAINGKVKFQIPNSKFQKLVKIRRVHLEEDTAKLIHTKEATLIDFNRAGLPLMEVVTEPDVRSPEEAKVFLKKLQQIIRYLKISDCDMEKGSMRIEPNISVRQYSKSQAPNSKQINNFNLPSYKVELKNINSFRYAEKAISYEVERQVGILEKGKIPLQETRGWDERRQVTFPQRSKEEAQDYRYFPEPDIPPIKWESKQIEEMKKNLPELPEQKIERFVKQFNLLNSQAEILSATQEKAEYFEKAVEVGLKYSLEPLEIAKILINKRVEVEKLFPAELIQVLLKKKAVVVLSAEELEKAVRRVIEGNKRPVADFRQGKTQAIEFLVGMVMRETKGKADPNEARNEIIKIIKINKD